MATFSAAIYFSIVEWPKIFLVYSLVFFSSVPILSIVIMKQTGWINAKC